MANLLKGFPESIGIPLGTPLPEMWFNVLLKVIYQPRVVPSKLYIAITSPQLKNIYSNKKWQACVYFVEDQDLRAALRSWLENLHDSIAAGRALFHETMKLSTKI